MTTTSYRLPRTVHPLEYAIDIDASPRRSAFQGELTLLCKATAQVQTIELHARDLVITRAVVKTGGQNPARLKAEVTYHSERETIALELSRPLPKGRHTVTLGFKGKLNPSMHGLYLAQDGAEKAIVSQCEATDARAIFPCFDEPDFKAKLQWTVRTDPGYVVITNGIEEKRSRTRKKPVRDVIQFKKTRVIPTYLAALTIGKYEGSEPESTKGIPVRIWAGKGKVKHTDFALAVTRQVLPWYQHYFNQKYNYEKLDQVAVPGFDAGAMENVGAIFYRQNLLLMQPGATSWNAQKRIAEVVAHEIAHQWFGNLVTMKWWDDLWLNEAFATWIAYKAVDAWRPDWRMWDDFLESKESALAADALVNTHPIYSEVKSPAEATELFDVITYEKGCGVLRMAESFLGEAAFRDGIRRYQAAFKNANATGADLWSKLEEASGEPVSEVMESWITQSGFPLVTVTMASAEPKPRLHLSQRRFYTNRAHMQRDSEQTWTIPMLIRYGTGNGSTVHRHVMRGAEETVELPEADTALWVYPNDQASGFFRTRFDDAALRALLDQGLRELGPASRAGLLEDQWALVRCGLSDIEQFMDVVERFREEHDYFVVRALTGRLLHIYQYVVAETDRDAFAHFVRWLFEPQYTELGWNPKPEEGPQTAVRRSAVLHALGSIGHDPAVLSGAEARVLEEMHDPTSLEPNIATTVTALGALRGDHKQLDRYVDTYLQRKRGRAAPALQLRYLSALSYFAGTAQQQRVLEMCLDGTVPQEQLRTVLQPMLTRRHSRVGTWAWLKDNWQTIAPKVGLMGIARLVEATGALPPDLREDVNQFFAAHPVEEAKRAVQKALETMDLRAELLAREQDRLSEWLRAHRSHRR